MPLPYWLMLQHWAVRRHGPKGRDTGGTWTQCLRSATGPLPAARAPHSRSRRGLIARRVRVTAWERSSRTRPKTLARSWPRTAGDSQTELDPAGD
jgi:hypothetical protein